MLAMSFPALLPPSGATLIGFTDIREGDSLHVMVTGPSQFFQVTIGVTDHQDCEEWRDAAGNVLAMESYLYEKDHSVAIFRTSTRTRDVDPTDGTDLEDGFDAEPYKSPASIRAENEAARERRRLALQDLACQLLPDTPGATIYDVAVRGGGRRRHRQMTCEQDGRWRWYTPSGEARYVHCEDIHSFRLDWDSELITIELD